MKSFKVSRTTCACFLGGTLLLAACAPKQQQPELTKSGLDPKNFVATVDGKETGLYTLTNANGMEVCITNFGGRIVSIMAPTRDGELKDVVLGFDSIGGYLNNQSDFGASIGRYANRIGQGRFVLDSDTVVLPQNNFGHCLHGGPTGWQYQIYSVREASDSTLTLDLTSPDGDNNFPGTVQASVQFTLTNDNEIAIAYSATTDKPTVINMTNHSYFNLSGDPTLKIGEEYLYLNADSITPVDSTYMTTGEITSVSGTPFDFTTRKRVDLEIEADDEQIHNGNGYDHNWVLSTGGDITVPAARLEDESTGIRLTVFTTELGIQVYTGNFLDGTLTGKKGITYQQRVGICLETQKYPDTPNKPQWPSATLRPGETYQSFTTFKFETF
jgi:aldose 1-epimerase